MSPQFWLELQMDYDLDVEEDKLGARLEEKSGRMRWQIEGVEKQL
jgi:plasmid maintenance system antidote protein VapI